MTTTRWPLLLALLGTAAYGAEVYRSTETGVVSYSDRPSEKSEPVLITAPRAGRPGNPITPRETKNAAGNAQANAQSGGQTAQPGIKPREQTPAERAAERTKNCQAAQERKTKYEEARRLYRELPNGEREYLKDSEIDAARSQAAADVGTWCG